MNKKETQTLKGKNAIKLLLITHILLFINVTSVQSQTWLYGSYKNNEGIQLGDIYAYYTFTKQGTFEFHQGGDFGDYGYAIGSYQIQDNLLLMEYTTEPTLITTVEKRIWDTF